MKFIEALKSGKRIYRPIGKGILYIEPGEKAIQLSRESLLADDWQIDESRKSLSATDIREAFRRVDLKPRCQPVTNPRAMIELLIEELGLA